MSAIDSSVSALISQKKFEMKLWDRVDTEMKHDWKVYGAVDEKQ